MVQHQQDKTPPHKRDILFKGDYVRLAGQLDLPSQPPPDAGYPLLFIIQHATCTSRLGYGHIARLGTELGIAVFRWDKRGTGHSGASSQGSVVQDTLNAYETALKQPEVDRERVILMAQSEGTLILGEHIARFSALQAPRCVLLMGNMLDEEHITAIPYPLHIVQSKNDWNAWQIYADTASKAHATRTKQPTGFYVAPNTNQRLMYVNGGTFHRGAEESIRTWLKNVCQISTSI